MPNTKPYVAAACLCEKVLIEQDGVASLIRIIDTMYLEPQPVDPKSRLPFALKFQVFVSVKSGDLEGEYEIGLLLRGPGDEMRSTHRWPVVFAQSPESGANLRIDFNLAGKEPGALPALGLYWFDVLWGDEVLTSVPLRLSPATPKTLQESPNKP